MIRRQQAGIGEGLRRTSHFHLAVSAASTSSSQTPIGESLAEYEPLVLWKGINSVEQAASPHGPSRGSAT